MKKYNLSEIMKNAWNNFRKGVKSFAEYLHDAWVAAKMLACGKLWEKYGKSRIYFDKSFLLGLCGLDYIYYRKSGNICYCEQNGEQISNADGSRWAVTASDFYYDQISGEFCGHGRHFDEMLDTLKVFLHI